MSVRRETTQAQLCLGVPGLRRDDPEAWTLEVLNAILGDGMSSRLFPVCPRGEGPRLRRQLLHRRLCRRGALVVSAGVDPDRIAPAVGAILERARALRDEPVPADELARSKRYLGGRLELRMEETPSSRLVAGRAGSSARARPDAGRGDGRAERRDGAGIHSLARRLIRDDGLRLALVAPARRGRRFESLCDCRGVRHEKRPQASWRPTSR
jgi:hypothetical protein